LNLENFLIVAAILFSIGLYGALSKRNAITVLMSIELMFNAVNVTAVALSRYVIPSSVLREAQTSAVANVEEAVQFLLTGQIFAIFIITVAAAEVALGLAIIIAIYRNKQSVFVTDLSEMRK
jgi:NADH:ubiquinone oxidoreductase subunit K